VSDVFISYARSTSRQAEQVADALRALGYRVWRDDELPAHRPYGEVIEERLGAAAAVVVIWSAQAARSQWVRSEADRARAAGKLVQLTLGGASLPMPFDQIQCADLSGWSGESDHPGFRKVAESVADLVRPRATGDRDVPVRLAPQARNLAGKPSVAVLPFANLSNDPEQEFFAEGMAEEIINALSHYRSIAVIANSSTTSFKSARSSPQLVGRELGVDFVLDGSVRRAAGKVRIAVKLAEAASGEQVWTHRFDDTLEDLFALQDKVAQQVAGVMQPAIEAVEARRIRRRLLVDMDGYELVLRARVLAQQAKGESALEAIDLVDRALQRDPGDGRASAIKAFCHANVVRYGWAGDVAAHRAHAVEHARRAIELAPDDGESIAFAAASFLLVRVDIDACKTLAARAISLNPWSTNAHRVNGWVWVLAGEMAAALESFELVMNLDPFSEWRFLTLSGYGMALYGLGRFAEAAKQLKESIQLRPSHVSSYPALAACQARLGEVDAARRLLVEYERLSPLAIDEYAAFYFARPDHRRLFLEGVALAAEPAPSNSPGGDYSTTAIVGASEPAKIEVT
jgi:adenylate cyclase